MFRVVLALVTVLGLLRAQDKPAGFGKPANPEKLRGLDITVFPDGKGLPVGHGSAVGGKLVYKDKCAVCHGDNGEGRDKQYGALKGGTGSLATQKPVKSVGSFWPYATTVWDYVHRAMPYDHPRSLTNDEVYAVTAFVLHINGIVPETLELNEKTLPKVEMPNRNGFVPDARPDIRSKR